MQGLQFRLMFADNRFGNILFHSFPVNSSNGGCRNQWVRRQGLVYIRHPERMMEANR